MPAGGGGVVGKPVSHRGGAPTHNISEKPEPTVGAPAPGADASRRRGCRQTRFAPRVVLLQSSLPPHPVGAPAPGANVVHGVQLGAKAYPMTPPLLTLYTWRL